MILHRNNMYPEQAAFEKQIDENPLDGDNHLIYADWLDDHGQSDEAAFRRSIGEWHKQKSWAYVNHNDIPENARPMYSHSISSNYQALPSGVEKEYLPSYLIHNRDTDFYTTDDKHPRVISTRYSWKSYRDMENALREAFMKKRQQNSTKFWRTRRARRFSRKMK